MKYKYKHTYMGKIYLLPMKIDGEREAEPGELRVGAPSDLAA
jgi:hypothetical protein